METTETSNNQHSTSNIERPLEAVVDRVFSYVTVRGSQTDSCPLPEVVARDLTPEYAVLFAAAPQTLKALREIANYMEVFTKAYGLTSRGAEVLANARSAEAAAIKEAA